MYLIKRNHVLSQKSAQRWNVYSAKQPDNRCVFQKYNARHFAPAIKFDSSLPPFSRGLKLRTRRLKRKACFFIFNLFRHLPITPIGAGTAKPPAAA
jgi:hypothetical protein